MRLLPFQNHRPPQDSHNRRRSSEQPQAHTASRQDHFTLHRNKGSSEQQLTLPPKTRGRDRGPRSRGVPAGSSGAHDTTAAEERPHSTPGQGFVASKLEEPRLGPRSSDTKSAPSHSSPPQLLTPRPHPLTGKGVGWGSLGPETGRGHQAPRKAAQLFERR